LTSRAAWEARVAKELDGKPADSLATALPEGFAAPALAPEDAVPPEADAPSPGVWPYRRGARRGETRPECMPRVDAGVPGWREQIEDDVEGGADALWIAGGAESPEPPELAAALAAAPDLTAGLDVGGDLARSRALVDALARTAPNVHPILFAEPFVAGVPADLPFAIPTHAWAGAGAHAAIELAYAAATGLHALRRLEDGGADLAVAAGRVGFSVSVGRDVLVEIAKLRNPHKRLTAPEDVARCIAALCHPATYWLTGNTLQVDGGESIVG